MTGRLTKVFLRTLLFSTCLAIAAACGCEEDVADDEQDAMLDDARGDTDPEFCGESGDGCETGADCCDQLVCDSAECAEPEEANCEPEGDDCTETADCCDGLACDDGQCIDDTTSCISAGNPCDGADECCDDLSCNANGVCGQTEQCEPTGSSCVTNGSCCSGNCQSGTCQEGDGICTPDYDNCDASYECCNGTCIDGLCEPDISCSAEGNDCDGDAECCSNNCQNGECVYEDGDDATACKAGGEPCDPNDGDECCTDCQANADGDYHCLSSGLCQVAGAPCQDDSECCTGACTDANVCLEFSGGIEYEDEEVPVCSPAGEVCDNHGDCCSNACYDDGRGFKICHSLGGCRVRGETCREDYDCCMNRQADCSSSTDPDSGQPQGHCNMMVNYDMGRCEHFPGPGRSVDGETCSSPGSPSGCCGICTMTSIGAARCAGWGGPDPGDPDACIADGEECSFDDECCNEPCDYNPDGDIVCNPCVEEGASCQADTDCCGATMCTPEGYCGCIDDGGDCTTDDECCDSDCNDAGYCGCIDDGDQCSDDTDCCQGNCNDNGICGPDDECVEDGQACSDDTDCCGNFCNPEGYCGCIDDGGDCTTDDECCTGNCNDDGVCGLDACIEEGDDCISDGDCCHDEAFCNADNVCEIPCGEPGDSCEDRACCDGLFCDGADNCQIEG